jgi:hypothetical protein
LPEATIYVLCPDDDTPSGGHKKLYRHVDVLKRGGFASVAVHEGKGFQYTWFKNNTPISDLGSISITKGDYLVIPEVNGPHLVDMFPGVKKVILNQNAYFTFAGYSLDLRDMITPYLHPDVVATIVVSDDNLSYLQYAFPQHNFLRMRYAIDPDLFYPVADKKKQICLMTRRNLQDAIQVINILKFRDALMDFDVVAIHDKSEADTAAMLRESMIFLSFSAAEGFGLPPAEAMACGCVTIGYHGRCGREFFRPEFSYPIEMGDIEGYARTVEQVIYEANTDPAHFIAKAKEASAFITETYSPQAESADIFRCWAEITHGDGMAAAEAL